MATYETYQVGDNEFSYVSFPLIVKKVAVKDEDLNVSNVKDIVIPAGYTVLGVSVYIATAFDNGADLQVGDGSTADYFLASGSCTPTSQYDFPTGFSKGKRYASAGVVRLTFSANPAAGEAYVYVLMINDSTNWRTKNDL